MGRKIETMRERDLSSSEVAGPREGGMARQTVHVTTRVGAEGPHRVDLPLATGDLNERLFDIGLWLIERKIPHQVRILMEPEHQRIRISFPEAADATAFRERFGARLN
jgi:hypothetical protein